MKILFVFALFLLIRSPNTPKEDHSSGSSFDVVSPINKNPSASASPLRTESLANIKRVDSLASSLNGASSPKSSMKNPFGSSSQTQLDLTMLEMRRVKNNNEKYTLYAFALFVFNKVFHFTHPHNTDLLDGCPEFFVMREKFPRFKYLSRAVNFFNFCQRFKDMSGAEISYSDFQSTLDKYYTKLSSSEKFLTTNGEFRDIGSNEYNICVHLLKFKEAEVKTLKSKDFEGVELEEGHFLKFNEKEKELISLIPLINPFAKDILIKVSEILDSFQSYFEEEKAKVGSKKK